LYAVKAKATDDGEVSRNVLGRGEGLGVGFPGRKVGLAEGLRVGGFEGVGVGAPGR